ncbi:DEAD/DEAH box helicase [Georgenia sp. 10Sc9-8]|uniref:DEAD/DEAH box helicase n=1 Tax=Georgenia halotolerans TaxID=3028317 RepID=A0ABT5TXH7_9MICO|nr:DEAD/DEAH box helicase [Georgenia halotolerans]
MSSSFASFDLPAGVVRHLETTGIATPFPIQAATLPDTLRGRDVLGRGRTGSGKTLAFALPLTTRLAGGRRQRNRPRGLVLAPTRELANQINAVVEPIARTLGLTTTTIFGGVNQARQVAALNTGVDIVIACPGRLEDLLNQKILTLDAVEVTVLDEADHMADLGFLPGVKRIMDRTPSKGQRMLFSATLDNGVDVLVKRYLTDPLRHSVDSADSPVAAMTHHVLALSGADDKKRVVQELASGTSKRLLFTRTKHQAKKLAKQLTSAGVPAVDLHGNLSQPARERNLAAFSSGGVKVLVATDIAARGIHVDEVELVVHVDPPAEHKAYLHRSGRTARAGSGGDVVTLMLPEQAGDVRTLTRQAKITARPTAVRPGDETLRRLVGEVAPYVAPAPAPTPVTRRAAVAGAPATSSAGSRSRGRRRGRSGGQRARAGAGGTTAARRPERRTA